MKKCAVIYNPTSGKSLPKGFLTEVVTMLIDYEYEPNVLYSKYRGHIIELVKEMTDVDLLISLGGDGTFNEVMTGNLARDKKLLLAHIPVGTTNDIGVMFGYGKNVIDNLKLLLSDGCEKEMDICLVNERPFVYVAGFGKFMNIPYDTKRETKKKLGYLAYVFQAFRSLRSRTKLYDVTYTIDNEEYNGLYSFMLIGNATRIAGINNFFYDVKLDDDRFEVLLCNLRMKQDIVRTLYYLGKTSIDKVPGFYFHKTDNLKIKFNSTDKISWCLDGEKFESDNNEFDIKVLRNIRIMLPKKNVDSLFKKK